MSTSVKQNAPAGNTRIESVPTSHRSCSRIVSSHAVHAVERCLFDGTDGGHDSFLIASALGYKVWVNCTLPILDVCRPNLVYRYMVERVVEVHVAASDGGYESLCHGIGSCYGPESDPNLSTMPASVFFGKSALAHSLVPTTGPLKTII